MFRLYVLPAMAEGEAMDLSRQVARISLTLLLSAGGLYPIVLPGSAQLPTPASLAILVGPICPGQNSVTVSNSTIGATLILQINSKDQGSRSAALGEVSLEIPDTEHLSPGDLVQVAQQVGNSTTLSNSIVVGCTDVLTYHNDPRRTGWNAAENTLTAANVNSNAFGLVAQAGPDVLDEQIDAQPLSAKPGAFRRGCRCRQ
jgi:hypothetical protein